MANVKMGPLSNASSFTTVCDWCLSGGRLLYVYALSPDNHITVYHCPYCVHYYPVRIGALPRRGTPTSGKTATDSVSRIFRAQNEQALFQICHRTHNIRIKRHNREVFAVEGELYYQTMEWLDIVSTMGQLEVNDIQVPGY